MNTRKKPSTDTRPSSDLVLPVSPFFMDAPPPSVFGPPAARDRAWLPPLLGDLPGTGLWRPETHSFVGPRLLRALVARGWTVAEFATAAHLHPSTVYHAIAGRRIQLGTAILIFQTLEKRQPMQIAAAG